MSKKHKNRDQNPTPETQNEPVTTTEEASSNPNEPQDNPSTKKSSWQIILTVIAIIAIVLVFALPSDKESTNDTDEETTQETDEMTTDTEEDTAPATNTSGEAVGIESMSPVVVGDEFVYQFAGIEWFLDPVDGKTQVSFMFDEFSRREGSIVAFGNPYRLGTFEGECEAVGNLSYDTTQTSGTPLAFVSCRSEDGTGSDIALFQKESEVFAAQRTITSEEVGEFGKFFSRDITTIVR